MLQAFLADQGHQVLQDLLVKMVSQDSLAPVACLASKVPLVRLAVKVLKVRNSPTSFHLVTASALVFWGLFFFGLVAVVALFLGLQVVDVHCTHVKSKKDPESGM